MIKLGLAEARERLETAADSIGLLARGALSVELLRPDGTDRSLRQDTIYLVQRGSGRLLSGQRCEAFAAGDLLLVPALASHRFASGDADLCVWVLSHGPVGGEQSALEEEE